MGLRWVQVGSGFGDGILFIDGWRGAIFVDPCAFRFGVRWFPSSFIDLMIGPFRVRFDLEAVE